MEIVHLNDRKSAAAAGGSARVVPVGSSAVSVHARLVRRAFILGAGLGTRLRPLTAGLPKPLVPVWNRPLITHAFDHLIAAGAADELVVNTHHAAAAYARGFANRDYRGRPLHLRHEPVLLDTAGGLANVADLLRDQPWALVYNGDVLSDLPLAPAIAAHEGRDAEVTLILRRQGPVTNVGFDPGSGHVVDVRGALGVAAPVAAQFTGIYLVTPRFLRRLEPGRIESVAAVWQRMLAAGQPLHGVLADEGWWLDLGHTDAYLEAHRELARQFQPGATVRFPRHAAGIDGGPAAALGPRISPTARLADAGVGIDPWTVVGADARIGQGVVLQGCVVWPDAEVPAGSRWRHRVVQPGEAPADG